MKYRKEKALFLNSQGFSVFLRHGETPACRHGRGVGFDAVFHEAHGADDGGHGLFVIDVYFGIGGNAGAPGNYFAENLS
ncbi:MAG: hypothetical protein RR280_09675 [Bacteroidaceae bacterium]